MLSPVSSLLEAHAVWARSTRVRAAPLRTHALGPAATTPGEHLAANSLKFLLKSPARFKAVLLKSSAVLPVCNHASCGRRISFGTSLIPDFGCINPNTGISSHSTEARDPSCIASMSCLVYFKLQRFPVP